MVEAGNPTENKGGTLDCAVVEERPARWNAQHSGPQRTQTPAETVRACAKQAAGGACDTTSSKQGGAKHQSMRDNKRQEISI